MDGRWMSRKLHRAVKIFNSLSPQEIIRSDVSLSLSLGKGKPTSRQPLN